MKYYSLFFLLYAACCCSCKREPDILRDDNGVAIKLPTLWSVPVSSGNYLGIGVDAPVVYQNRYVLCPGGGGGFGKAVLHMVDAQTGSLKWKWNDYVDKDDNIDVTWFYTRNNLFLSSLGSKTRVINMDTGETVWRRKKKDGMTSNITVAGIGDDYYFVGIGYNEQIKQSKSSLFRGRITFPTEEELVIPADFFPREYEGDGLGYGGYGVQAALPFVHQGDTMVVASYASSTPNPDPKVIALGVHPYFGVFNVSRHQWLYKGVELAKPGVSMVVDGMPVISNGKVYHNINRLITCHDLLTGREIWRRQFNANFLFGGFIITDGVLVANCEDLFIYGLNPETGQELWKEPSSGSPSRMYDLNGVVYFAGGGDGYFHAVDVKTGKHLWRLESPDKKRNSSAFFYLMAAGIPGFDGKKGVIVAHTGLHVYGYEAAR